MGAATFPLLPDPRERLRGTVLASLGLHVLLLVTALGYTRLGPHFGNSWGTNATPGDSVQVKAVASVPGIALPSPTLTTPNTLATENPGRYKTEPEPKPEPKEEAEEIPKFKEAVKLEKAERINKHIQKVQPEIPENAVPFGLGGQPAQSYSEFSKGASEGGIGIGEPAFGERYGWYVTALRNRISSNWLESTISPSLMSAPRVYITFDILRDGTITNIEITQSSGMPEVDRSALRAVQASSPLSPLPPDYSGNQVSVKFYFDFRR